MGNVEFDRNVLDGLILSAKEIAVKYYALTKKPLGITGEYGEWIAAARLGLILAPARQKGFDARRGEDYYQIKSRCIPDLNKLSKQRIGLVKPQGWDFLVVVIFNQEYTSGSIYVLAKADYEKLLEEHPEYKRSGAKLHHLKPKAQHIDENFKL